MDVEVLEVLEITEFKVLVVEDNDVIGRVMSTVFQKAGCEVTLAVTGGEALEHFYHNKYDLILMDIGLPDYNGLYISKLIRTFHDKQKACTPIAIITAHSEIPQHILDARKLGIEDFIIKPCTINICYMLIKKYALGLGNLNSRVGQEKHQNKVVNH